MTESTFCVIKVFMFKKKFNFKLLLLLFFISEQVFYVDFRKNWFKVTFL